MKYLFIIFFILFLFPSSLDARNVSYVGGWTLLETLDDTSVSGLLHYTVHRNLAFGYRYEYFREEEWHYNALQVNILGKRWNNPGSQANFYLLSTVGAAYSDYKHHDGRTEPALSTGIATDWEDRRFFVSYENRLMYAGDIHQDLTQKARVGIAPYVAEFDSLHTWIMVEVGHTTDESSRVNVTPLVRLFKGPVMAEIGWTIEGEAMVNFRILF